MPDHMPTGLDDEIVVIIVDLSSFVVTLVTCVQCTCLLSLKYFLHD